MQAFNRGGVVFIVNKYGGSFKFIGTRQMGDCIISGHSGNVQIKALAFML